MKELIEIQRKLKAPKGQRNTFGNYNYRSAEDILEAVKPLCAEHGCQLTLSDAIELVGDRYYVKAIAQIRTADETVEVTAYARESASKKGMDESQITGTASSYARKYALNGLFCIDDTKDADTDDYARRTGAKSRDEVVDDIKEREIWRGKVLELANEKGIKAAELSKDYKLGKDTTVERFKEVYADLKGEGNEAAK